MNKIISFFSLLIVMNAPISSSDATIRSDSTKLTYFNASSTNPLIVHTPSGESHTLAPLVGLTQPYDKDNSNKFILFTDPSTGKSIGTIIDSRIADNSIISCISSNPNLLIAINWQIQNSSDKK